MLHPKIVVGAEFWSAQTKKICAYMAAPKILGAAKMLGAKI